MKMRILADRNMRVLLIGQAMNMPGNTALLVVLGIWVKTLTGSSADAGPGAQAPARLPRWSPALFGGPGPDETAGVLVPLVDPGADAGLG